MKENHEGVVEMGRRLKYGGRSKCKLECEKSVKNNFHFLKDFGDFLNLFLA